MHLIPFALILLSLASGLPLNAQHDYSHNNSVSPSPLPTQSHYLPNKSSSLLPLNTPQDYSHNNPVSPRPLQTKYHYLSNKNSIDTALLSQYTADSDTIAANRTPQQNQHIHHTSTPTTEKRWFFLHAGIGYYATGADWSQRYPTHLSVPLSVEYSHRSDWSFGADYSIFLGSNVNDQNLYGEMVNDSGLLLDMNGFPAVIRTYQRGFSTRVFVLKNWILYKHRNSRVLLQTGGGVGYYQHYTKFTFDVDQVPQIDGNFQGGYNRHTQGTQLFEQVKIQYINNDAISFSLGFEAGQGNGSRLHPYDFAQQKMQTQRVRDTYIGGVFSIMIPINFRDRISEVDYYME